MAQENILLSDFQMDRKDLLDIFSVSLGRALLNQKTCAERIANQDWEMQFTSGKIRFGSEYFPLQLVGTESSVSHTWMWGWNNINHFPESVIELAQKVNSFGQKHGTAELINPQLKLNDINNGLVLSVVACNISEENYCYYRVPHGEGVVWAAFSGFEPTTDLDAAQFMSLTLDSIQKYDLEHRLFVQGLLRWCGVPYDMSDSTHLLAKFDQNVMVNFDDFGRIISMEMR